MTKNNLQKLIALLEIHREQLGEFEPFITIGRHSMFLTSLMHFNKKLHHELLNTQRELKLFHQEEQKKFNAKKLVLS